MNEYQGDEGGIVVEFLYSRLRGNTGGWEVAPMDFGPEQVYPAYGFTVTPSGLAREQGGDVLTTTFDVLVVAVGDANVDTLEPLRPMIREAARNLQANSSQPGLRFGDGMVISSVQGLAHCFSDRDRQGVLRWHLGHVWHVTVQPDATW